MYFFITFAIIVWTIFLWLIAAHLHRIATATEERNIFLKRYYDKQQAIDIVQTVHTLKETQLR